MVRRRDNPTDEAARILGESALADLREKNASLNDKVTDLQSKLQQAITERDAVFGVREGASNVQPRKLVIKAQRRGEATFVGVCSDWHLEEQVDPATINNLNEFDLTIASERIKKLFNRFLAELEKARTVNRINSMVLALIGDFITGFIHEDLAESNYLTPLEALRRAKAEIMGGIDFLLENANLEKLRIPCACGNHGRTTHKPRITTANKNNYEWFLYNEIADHYASDGRVEFTIPGGYFSFVEIYGRLFRFHHGDGVIYHGGVGEITIPLNKSINQWNKEPIDFDGSVKPVYCDVLGHWHQRMIGGNHIINGALIGYTAYSRRIKATYDAASQLAFVVHPDYGRTDIYPIYLSKRRRDVSLEEEHPAA